MSDQELSGLIFIYSAVILIGGLLGGSLPLIFNKFLKDKKIIVFLNLFGAGLLLGVGVLIIIPKG